MRVAFLFYKKKQETGIRKEKLGAIAYFHIPLFLLIL
jgi:hypothetical protein